MNADVTCAATTLPAPAVRRRPSRIALALLAVITALLFALGAMGWWYLAKVDARYRRVLSATAASMNEIHEVGLHAFTGYGALMELHHIRDPQVRAARLKTVAAERAANDRLYEKLNRSLTDPEQYALLQEVIAHRATCRTQGDALLAKSQGTASTLPGPNGSAEFLQSCIVYQQACNKLTDHIEAASLTASTELTAEIVHMRWMFLGVGVLPLVGALTFFTLTLGLLQVVKIDGEME